jgi:hypothetical protein
LAWVAASVVDNVPPFVFRVLCSSGEAVFDERVWANINSHGRRACRFKDQLDGRRDCRRRQVQEIGKVMPGLHAIADVADLAVTWLKIDSAD